MPTRCHGKCPPSGDRTEDVTGRPRPTPGCRLRHHSPQLGTIAAAGAHRGYRPQMGTQTIVCGQSCAHTRCVLPSVWSRAVWSVVVPLHSGRARSNVTLSRLASTRLPLWGGL